jgi:hypothetical protein
MLGTSRFRLDHQQGGRVQDCLANAPLSGSRRASRSYLQPQSRPKSVAWQTISCPRAHLATSGTIG